MQGIDRKAAIGAGLIAGVAFMMLEMVLVATAGEGSPWDPPRMIAAILMGESVLPPPASFDLTMFLVAMSIHLVLSVLLALAFALVADRAGWGLGTAAVAGMIFGLVIYFFNFYAMTVIFPWFAMARGAISIFAHLAFGLLLGYLYRRFAPIVVQRV